VNGHVANSSIPISACTLNSTPARAIAATSGWKVGSDRNHKDTLCR
jgi:hypothetical protein